MVVNGDTGGILTIFPGRSKQALSRFFIEQGPRWYQNVQTVVSDGSRSYQTAIIRYFPSARHILNRFRARFALLSLRRWGGPSLWSFTWNKGQLMVLKKQEPANKSGRKPRVFLQGTQCPYPAKGAGCPL